MPSDGHLPRKVKIFRLGFQELGLPDNGDELFANIGEMYFALIFLSLQHEDLKLWLPEDAPLDRLERGLNVALPLHQPWADMSKFGMAKCLKSKDPEIVAYALGVLANNRAKIVEDKYRQNMVSLRNLGKWGYLFREGRPGETIDTKCSKCGWQSVDHFPRWVLRTDEYVARLQGCQQCPLGVRDKKTKRKYASTTFVPLNTSERFINAGTFYSRIEKRPPKEMWRRYYAFESDEMPGFGGTI